MPLFFLVQTQKNPFCPFGCIVLVCNQNPILLFQVCCTQFCCFGCVCSSFVQKPKKLFAEKGKKIPQFFHFGCVILPFSKPNFVLFWVHCSSLYKNPKNCCKIVQFCGLEHCISSWFQNRKIVVLDALFFLVQKPQQFFLLLFWMCLSWV